MSSIWKQHIMDLGDTISQGVATLFKKKLRPMIHQSKIDDDDAYYIIADVTLDEQRYTLANMHARGVPTGQKFKLQAMMESISDLGNASLILGGDFNLIFDQSLDVMGGSECDRDAPYSSTLKSYMEEWLLSDT